MRKRSVLFPMLILGVLLPAALPVHGDAADVSATTIGIYVDAGAHPSCSSSAGAMFRWMGFTTRGVTAADVNAGGIEGLAAIYFPGGSSPPYIQNITPAGKAGLLAAIEAGMAFIGTCAGAMFAAEVQVWEGRRGTYGQLGAFRGEAVGPAPGVCSGSSGVCATDLRVTAECCAEQGSPQTVRVTYYNSPFLRPDPDSETLTLATYATTGDAAVVAQPRGAGWVLLTGPHFEWEAEPSWTFLRRVTIWILGLSEGGA